MQIIRDEQRQLLQIWLTKDDQVDGDVMLQVGELIQQGKKERYLPVLYRSGQGDLYGNTLALLQYNRKSAAQKEVLAQRVQSEKYKS